MSTKETTTLFKLLADQTRLNIIVTLIEAQGRDLCVNEIATAVGMSQSATSHQLAKLEAYDVVTSYREGQKVCYILKESKSGKNIEKAIKAVS